MIDRTRNKVSSVKVYEWMLDAVYAEKTKRRIGRKEPTYAELMAELWDRAGGFAGPMPVLDEGYSTPAITPGTEKISYAFPHAPGTESETSTDQTGEQAAGGEERISEEEEADLRARNRAFIERNSGGKKGPGEAGKAVHPKKRRGSKGDERKEDVS